jgi:VanZ family protein
MPSPYRFQTCFPSLYIAFALLQATLLPYDFYWPSSLHWPIWYFDVRDVAQNVLVFFPLGVVLVGATGGKTLRSIGLAALLSAGIEIAQLFIVGRNSNVQDVVSNTLGAVAGIIYVAMFVPDVAQQSFRLSLGMMIAPLCWIVAFRSLENPGLSWLVLPLGIAALTLLSKIRVKFAGAAVWLIAACVPMIYLGRDNALFSIFNLAITPGLMVAAVLVASLCVFHRLPVLVNPVSLILCGVTFVLFAVDGMWLATVVRPINWHFMSHLHWIDAVMSFLLAGFGLLSTDVFSPKFSSRKSSHMPKHGHD